MNPFILPFFFTLNFVAYLVALFIIGIKSYGPVYRLRIEYQACLMLTAASLMMYYLARLVDIPIVSSVVLAAVAFVVGAYGFIMQVVDQWSQTEW